jgi:uncharacterized RDD family membrane protein YckC
VSVDVRHEADATERVQEKTVQAAGFGLRAAALLVDMVLVWFLGLLLGTFVGVAGLLLTMYSPGGPPPMNRLIILSGLVFSVAYFVVSWARGGQTLGKMAVDIKVVGADGQPPSWGKAVLRYVGYIVNGIVLSIGFLWALFDRRRQGWHDKLAGTFVVYGDESFTDVNAVTIKPTDHRRWVWIVLWVILALVIPGALALTIWGMGPYLADLLITILRP